MWVSDPRLLEQRGKGLAQQGTKIGGGAKLYPVVEAQQSRARGGVIATPYTRF